MQFLPVRYRVFWKLIMIELLALIPFVLVTLKLDADFEYFLFGLKLSKDVLQIIAIVVAGLIGLSFIRLKFMRPLDEVTKQIASVIASKPYEKIFIESKDEFGLLAYFFNDVTKNIENISYFLKEGSRMSSDLNIAADIQRSVLPKEIPVIDYLDTVAKTRSADELGGDSFDIVQKGDEYFIYVGDVTGHGAGAGLVMMVMNTLFDLLLPNSENTYDLAVEINKELKPRVNAALFMTSVFFRWNPKTKKMHYTGAGHEHILVYRASEGVTEVIVTGGVALAMSPDISKIAKEKELKLNDQDIVLLYSDGITEAVNDHGELYGLDRVKESLTRNASLGSSLNVFEGVSKDVISFVGNTVQKDDMTLLVMRYVENGYDSDRKENLVSTSWKA
jgi:serine phosphatase RsbU (regulator of sigma subunit)